MSGSSFWANINQECIKMHNRIRWSSLKLARSTIQLEKQRNLNEFLECHEYMKTENKLVNFWNHQVSSGWLQVSSDWIQVSPCWIQVGSGWIPVSSCWIQVSSGWIPVNPCWIPVSPCWIQVSSGWIQVSPCWIQVSSGWIPVSPCWIQVSSGWIHHSGQFRLDISLLQQRPKVQSDFNRYENYINILQFVKKTHLQFCLQLIRWHMTSRISPRLATLTWFDKARQRCSTGVKEKVTHSWNLTCVRRF